MTRRLLLTVVLIAFAAGGCSVLTIKKPAEEATATRQRADRVAAELARINSGLHRFKGLGDVVVEDGDTHQNARIAWVAEHPGKIRFTLMVGGRPQVSMASDASWVTLFRHDTGFYHRTRAAHASLGAFLPIRIQAADLTAMLAGRIPIRDHHRAELIADQDSGQQLLVLKKWWRTVEIIRFSEDPLEVSEVAFFDGSAQLLYRATLSSPAMIDRFRIPMRIGIEIPDKALIEIGIERYWPHIPMTENMFVIPPPG